MELQESNRQPESPSKFVGTMAEKLGAAARAATIFGEPVERDGVTVILWPKLVGVLAAAPAAEKMKMEPAEAVVRKLHPWDLLNSRMAQQNSGLSKLFRFPG
jgi:hypothetical protein